MNTESKSYAIVMVCLLLIGNIITSITMETSINISDNKTDISTIDYHETLQNPQNQPENEKKLGEKVNYAIHSSGNIFEDSDEFISGSMTNLTIDNEGYLSLEKEFIDNWKDVTTPGPSSRSGHAMAYDSSSNKVLLFGGMNFDESEYFSDTWVYDLVTNEWTELHPEHPPDPRAYHSMVYDSEENKFFLYGGYGLNEYYEYDCLDDVWIYDLAEDRWDFVDDHTPMGGRCGQSMVYDFYDRRIIVFGGMDPDTETYFDDTWMWESYGSHSVEMWNETQYLPISPSPRAFHSMVIDVNENHPDERKIILFGGLDADGELSDTWRYDFGYWTQLNPSTSPNARFGHSMIFNPYNDKVILFGGFYFDSYEYDYYEYGDTWFFDHSALNWTQLNPSRHPSNRGFCTMIFSPLINKTMLFGGCTRWDIPPWGDPQTYNDDMWIYLGSCYFENGTYLSQITDFNNIYLVDGNISWYSNLPRQNTSLEVQIGFSNSTDDADLLYSDLNTSNFTFTILARYLRYRVIFKSDLIQNSTPQLEWVNISYSLGKPKPSIHFSSPQNNSLAEGLVSICAAATSPNGIENVSFYIGGLLVICMYSTPYNFTWNSEMVENGYVVVEAKARTVLGEENSCKIQLLVENFAFTKPSIPINLHAIAKDDFINLSWTGPTDDGGSPILRYNIYRGITTGEYIHLGVTTDTNFTDDSVIGGFTYYYVVTAVNSIGEGSFSEEVNILAEDTTEIVLTVPSAPQALSASAGENHVELSWTTPNNDGG